MNASVVIRRAAATQMPALVSRPAAATVAGTAATTKSIKVNRVLAALMPGRQSTVRPMLFAKN